VRFTKKAQYAIVALLDIANHADMNAVRLKDISERQKISLDYLEQIFKNLRELGLVKSIRGPGGGYMISKSLEKITVKDVFRSLNEKRKIDTKKYNTPEWINLRLLLAEIELETVSILDTTLDKFNLT